MKKNKTFLFFYAVALTAFVSSGIALAVRFAELRRAEEFYGQTRQDKKTISFAASSSILRKNASEQSVWPENQTYEALSRACPDMAAWLSIPDTPVNYPVMFGADNAFYLNHLPDGSENKCGSLFFDCRCEENSFHLIIYGHNAWGGKMFGSLKRYESRDYFDEHAALTIMTADSVYVCPVFSVRRVSADSDAYTMEFRDSADRTDYVNRAVSESLYPIDIDCSSVEKVLTLSTCTGRRDQRLIVQAFFPAE